MERGPIWGWKLRSVSAAVLEDQYAHASPLGTVRNRCPGCAAARDMTCYELPEGGPFGHHTGLHLVCPVCGAGYGVDRADEARVRAVLVPTPGAGGA